MKFPSSDPVVLSRSRAVGLSPSQVPLAAHSPAGLPDRCAASNAHPTFPPHGRTMRVAATTALLLHATTSVSAFHPAVNRAFSISQPRLRRSSALCANEFDDWWKARKILHDGQRLTQALETLPLDSNSVAVVLNTFVRSSYAKQLCDYCYVQPTDYFTVEGMFQTVKLIDNRIEIELKDAFKQRSKPLLDRLALYLKARVPGIVQMQAVERWDPTAPPSVISTRPLL